MLDPFHQDIKKIVAMQYQPHPMIRALATEMELKAVKLISTIFRWINDTYKLLLVGGNIK